MIRRFLLACALWLACAPAWAAISCTSIGTAHATSGATLAITVGVGGVPSGSLIFLDAFEGVGNTNPTAAGSVADTATNSYGNISSVAANNDSATNGRLSTYYAWNSLALVQNNTITFTLFHIDNGSAISAMYCTGIQISSDPKDGAVTATAFGSSGTPSVTSGTPGQSGELFVGVIGGPILGTFGQATGWATPPNESSQSGNSRVDGGNQVNAGSGTLTYNPTITSHPWAAAVAGFKAAAASVACPKTLKLLGVGC